MGAAYPPTLSFPILWICVARIFPLKVQVASEASQESARERFTVSNKEGRIHYSAQSLHCSVILVSINGSLNLN